MNVSIQPNSAFPLISGLGFTNETTYSFPHYHWAVPLDNANMSPLSGYIGDFDIIDDHRSGKIVIQLNGRLNKTGVISPRFNVQVTQIESWVNLLLPARSFGKLILVSTHLVFILLGMLTICMKTTSSGILDHEEARRKNVGGKILGYVY